MTQNCHVVHGFFCIAGHSSSEPHFARFVGDKRCRACQLCCLPSQFFLAVEGKAQNVSYPEQWDYTASTSPAVPIASARVPFQSRAGVVKITDWLPTSIMSNWNHPPKPHIHILAEFDLTYNVDAVPLDVTDIIRLFLLLQHSDETVAFLRPKN